MRVELLKTSRKLWPSMTYIPRELARANQLKWARAVQKLGDKWLLAQQVMKKE